jgi:hypothetical protein
LREVQIQRSGIALTKTRGNLLICDCAFSFKAGTGIAKLSLQKLNSGFAIKGKNMINQQFCWMEQKA